MTPKQITIKKEVPFSALGHFKISDNGFKSLIYTVKTQYALLNAAGNFGKLKK